MPSLIESSIKRPTKQFSSYHYSGHVKAREEYSSQAASDARMRQVVINYGTCQYAKVGDAIESSCVAVC